MAMLTMSLLSMSLLSMALLTVALLTKVLGGDFNTGKEPPRGMDGLYELLAGRRKVRAYGRSPLPNPSPHLNLNPNPTPDPTPDPTPNPSPSPNQAEAYDSEDDWPEDEGELRWPPLTPTPVRLACDPATMRATLQHCVCYASG